MTFLGYAIGIWIVIMAAALSAAIYQRVGRRHHFLGALLYGLFGIAIAFPAARLSGHPWVLLAIGALWLLYGWHVATQMDASR